MSVRIAISIGDYNGIGPEVALKTLQTATLTDCTPIILGDQKIVDFYLHSLSIPLAYTPVDSMLSVVDGQVNVLNCLERQSIDIQPGKLSRSAGKCAMLAVEKGIELGLADKTDALVTASISKEAVNQAGYKIPGHTEFLAEKTDTQDFIMMMVNEELRVGLLSTHVPLGDVVSKWLSKERIVRYIKIISNSLRRDFGIDKPHVAVLGVNPHAGDGGMIGREEIDIITPAILEAQSDENVVEGPFPADGFFGNRSYKQYDGVLAM